MTLSIVVVCEAEADFRIASTLADRVVCERVAWIETDLLPHLREFVGLSGSEQFLRWDRADEEAKARNIRVHGGFPDGPAELEAKMVRRAIRLVHFALHDNVVIVLIRDDDNTQRRQRGFEQARSHAKNPDRIVIGIAKTKRECWVLNGFEPRDEVEHEMLRDERHNLGFDPSEQSHRLTAKHIDDKLSAKRVLARLTNGLQNREVECWETTSLSMLRIRGESSGLTAYLKEIDERLVPCFSFKPPA